MAMNTGWDWFDNLFKNFDYDGNAINKSLTAPLDPRVKSRAFPQSAKERAFPGTKSTLKPVEQNSGGFVDNWQNQSNVYGRNNTSNGGGPPGQKALGTFGANSTADVENSILEGYLTEIQDRLASSRAVAPTITLDTKPIDSAQQSSKAALAQALDTVLKSIGTARTNTTNAYNSARDETKGAYDAIENRSRTEGTKAARESGENVSEELAKAASVAMAGINQDLTESDDLLARASANLGGNRAAMAATEAKVNPNDSTATIRDNIAQNYQDQAGNAARQTTRDVQSAGRYADTIGTDGASAIANLMSELAGRNNQFDRDISSAQTNNAQSVANIDSAYADKLMQAQLAQQQEQNAVNNTAWQTNIANDNTALNGLLEIMANETKARGDLQTAQLDAQSKNAGYSDKSKYNQIEILLKGLVGNTDNHSLSAKDIQDLLASIQ